MTPPLSSPNVLQPKLSFSPTHKGWVYFTAALGFSLGLIWVYIAFLVHLYHYCRVPLSFPTGHGLGPQLRNRFPSHLVGDQKFINFLLKDASRKTSLLGRICASSVKGSVGGTEHYQVIVTRLRAPSLASCLNTFTYEHPHSAQLTTGTDAMAVLVIQYAPLHRGDFAHSAASSPKQHCKDAYPGANASQPCSLGKAPELLLFTSIYLPDNNYRGKQYYLCLTVVEGTNGQMHVKCLEHLAHSKHFLNNC